MLADVKPKHSQLSLTDPVTVLRGVSDVTAKILASGLNVRSMQDLIRLLPVRYEDRTAFSDLTTVNEGEMVVVGGRVSGAENIPTRSRVTLTKVRIVSGNTPIDLVFFNQWFLKKQFEKLVGQSVVVFGRLGSGRSGTLELTEVEWEATAAAKDALASDRIVPVYPLTEGITQSRLRKIMYTAVGSCADMLTEWIPHTILNAHALIDIGSAWKSIHFPETADLLAQAKFRVAFEEFFVFQVWIKAHRNRQNQQGGVVFTNTKDSVSKFRTLLPFTLTGAQNRAIEEIAIDMGRAFPMRRLLQGDVGSGKTVVAAAAMHLAANNDYQSALMAPTELLAQQHYDKLSTLFPPDLLALRLLTGSTSPKERTKTLEDIATGHVDVVVGTHSLIQDSVVFHRLGLIVVDEQHRFGVQQRSALRDKGSMPDTLAMTATPIPRSLSLTVYGDLDLTTIDELPKGRQTIKTHWKSTLQRQDVYHKVAELVRNGDQAYVVCSLINDNENLQALAAVELAGELMSGAFSNLRVGLLHGQMKSVQKQDTMNAFRDNRLDVLVATSVIEVGVDVPNATIMVIENAERFGMAQLHQLRGRVGRGSKQSYCILIADAKNPRGAARLRTIAQTTDGFEIAEQDLKLRGPGDLYGVRQSGMLNLPFFNVSDDISVLYAARDAADVLLSQDPMLKQAQHMAIRDIVRERGKDLVRAQSA